MNNKRKPVLIIFIGPLLLLANQCGIQNTDVEFNSKFTYIYDTISRTYTEDFTGANTGGIDQIYLDSMVFIAYNYCGDNTIKIVNHTNDGEMKILNYTNPHCAQHFVALKNSDVYLTTADNKVYRYCNDKSEPELVVDLMSIDKFKESGLTVEWNKQGSDQYVRVPENFLYFRVNQNFDRKDGKYSNVYAGYPVFAKLNIETKEIDFFGKMPKFSVDNDYGLIGSYLDLFIGDSIFTSLEISGEIEIINTKLNSVSKKMIKSKYDTVDVKKLKYNNLMEDSKNRKLDHALYSAHYRPLFYNPYNRRFYRIFNPAMNEFDEDGLKNTTSDSKCILMVFNENLEVIDEVLLPIRSSRVLKLFPTIKGIDIYLPDLFSFTKERAEYKFLRIEHD